MSHNMYSDENRKEAMWAKIGEKLEQTGKLIHLYFHLCIHLYNEEDIIPKNFKCSNADADALPSCFGIMSNYLSHYEILLKYLYFF